MPIAAIIVGAIMIDLAFRGTEYQFGKQLAADFGNTQFWAWAAAIGIIGALAYYKPLRPVSYGLATLVIVSMVVSDQGAFARFEQLVTNPPAPQPSVPLSDYANPNLGLGATAQKSGGGGIGGIFGDIIGVAAAPYTGGASLALASAASTASGGQI
jgi:hypothetical protein